jgi:hypothetical protein
VYGLLRRAYKLASYCKVWLTLFLQLSSSETHSNCSTKCTSLIFYFYFDTMYEPNISFREFSLGVRLESTTRRRVNFSSLKRLTFWDGGNILF